MTHFFQDILKAKDENKTLFYNTSGSKKAYQLGVKHLGSAEFLGFCLALPNGDLDIKKEFLLVNFENETINKISKGSRLTPVKLKNL